MPRVLLTGANGHLGRKLSADLSGRSGIDLVRLGFETGATDGDCLDADLSIFHAGWARHFAGCDCVVHLAGHPRSTATWAEVQRLNIDLSLNVMRAARIHGVGRMVFASSNWVMAGYRHERGPITTDMPPRPQNAYGAAKLFIERLGKEAAEAGGLDFFALRIGWVLAGENIPHAQMGRGRWGQEMWLGDADLCNAFHAAITTGFRGFVVANVVSANAGTRWTSDTARTALGWTPGQQYQPVETPVMYLVAKAQRVAWTVLQKLSARGVTLAARP